jgi:hypothetical protein
MNRVLQLLIFIIFNYASINSLSAQIIKNIPRLQAAGIINLYAESHDHQDTVRWKVTSYFIDEVSNVFSYSADTIYSKGDSLRVLLIKKANKYTYYKIFANNSTQSDSITLQVIIKGVPQKYLYPNVQMPGKPIPVFIVLPYNLSNPNFVMVMHGTDRNALDYVEAWKLFARENNYIIAAPLFSETDWPYSRSYNLGNMFTGSNGTGILNPDTKWSFTIVQNIHNDLVDALGLQNESYDIWGHSAGSQFVHRLMTFKTDYKIRYAIAANAGWYTIPDFQINYPYGLKHPLLDYEENFLEDLVLKNLVIMRGTADTIRDSNLNTSAEADLQGKNRYERALNYYNYGLQTDPNTNWRLIDVPSVGHDYVLMSKAAQQFLLNPTSVKVKKKSIIKTFLLYQNYPNPFNPSTTIKYSVPSNIKSRTSNVKIIVYDILGNEIATLVDENKPVGNYEVKFDGSNLAGGVYFYKLQSGSFAETKKFLLLK